MTSNYQLNEWNGIRGTPTLARFDRVTTGRGWARARKDRWEASTRAAESRERARQIATTQSTHRSFGCDCNLRDELGMPACRLGS